MKTFNSAEYVKEQEELDRKEKEMHLTIAKCSRGHFGLILSKEPQKIIYSDGTTGLSWTGIHLQDHPEFNIKVGDAWSSRNPNKYERLELDEESVSFFETRSKKAFREAIEASEKFKHVAEFLANSK